MRTDLSYLLSTSDGNIDIINEMIDIFTSQIKEIAEEMVRFKFEKDYEKLSNLAHKAKSSVAIMGMKGLAQDLKELELMAKDRINSDLYQSYISKFIKETEEAVKELNNYRNEQLNCKLP